MPFPPHVFCDTSFFYACFDRNDANYDQAKILASHAASAGTTLCMTWDIISETVTLLHYRQHFQAALMFLSDVKPELRIVPLSGGVYVEAEQIFRRYGHDHRLSFCDALSFVVVTTLLADMPCFAFDADFRALGLTVCSAFGLS